MGSIINVRLYLQARTWHTLQQQKCCFPQVTAALMHVIRRGIFIPPEWIVSSVSLCIYWLSSVHTLHICRVGYPSPSSSCGRRLLEVCNHQGWVVGWRGGGWGVCVFYYLEVKMMNWCRRPPKKKKSIRCLFHQSCFPQMSAWSCLSRMRTIDARRNVYSVCRERVNVCVSVPCFLALRNSAVVFCSETNPTPRLKIWQH